MATKVKLDYPWHLAPPEANFAATEPDGFSSWYSKEPLEGRWTWEGRHWVNIIPTSHVDPCPHWRSTLQARPVAKRKAKAATYMMPGQHTMGASSPSGRVTAVPVKPKAKKVRKQWCLVTPVGSKKKAEKQLRFIQIFDANGGTAVMYLPVGRGRNGGAK